MRDEEARCPHCGADLTPVHCDGAYDVGGWELDPRCDARFCDCSCVACAPSCDCDGGEVDSVTVVAHTTDHDTQHRRD